MAWSLDGMEPMRDDQKPNTTGQQAAPAPAHDGSAPQRKCVLVVDDELDTAIMLSLLLKRIGYDVITAYDGADGLNWVEKIYPTAVLLDLGMPGMDGFEMCRAIRSTEWGKHVKMIAVTGRGEPEDKLLTKEAGFDLHLVKPVDTWTLEKALGPAVGY